MLLARLCPAYCQVIALWSIFHERFYIVQLTSCQCNRCRLLSCIFIPFTRRGPLCMIGNTNFIGRAGGWYSATTPNYHRWQSECVSTCGGRTEISVHLHSIIVVSAGSYFKTRQCSRYRIVGIIGVEVRLDTDVPVILFQRWKLIEPVPVQPVDAGVVTFDSITVARDISGGITCPYKEAMDVEAVNPVTL